MNEYRNDFAAGRDMSMEPAGSAGMEDSGMEKQAEMTGGMQQDMAGQAPGMQIPDEVFDKAVTDPELAVKKLMTSVFGRLSEAGDAAGAQIDIPGCDGSTCGSCVYGDECVGRVLLDMIGDFSVMKKLLHEADRLMPLMAIPSTNVHRAAGRVMESYCTKADDITDKWNDYFYKSDTNPINNRKEAQ